jgi:hypothetical protein
MDSSWFKTTQDEVRALTTYYCVKRLLITPLFRNYVCLLSAPAITESSGPEPSAQIWIIYFYHCLTPEMSRSANNI